MKNLRMKKIFISAIAANILLLAACSKNLLNKQPLDAYSNSSLWSDSSDAAAALIGVYAGGYNPMPVGLNYVYNPNNGTAVSGWADGDLIPYMDCISDNAYDQFQYEGFQDYGNGLATSTDPNLDVLWQYLYENVQKCNWFLENINNTPMGATGMAQMIGQVRFIRAWQYFWLTQCYGDVVLDSTSVTVQQANTSVKTGKDTVVAFMLRELTAAIPNLPLTYPASQQGMITQGAAIALRMRIELYQQDWQNCINDAQQIMNLGIYSLYPSYADLFRIQHVGSSEDILDVQYMVNIKPNSVLGVMVPTSLGGWSSIDPLQSLVDNYETITGKVITDQTSGYDSTQPYANRDPRLTATILVPGQFGNGIYYDPLDASSLDYYSSNNSSRSGYEVRKYTSNLSDFTNSGGTMWNNSLSMMLIRYAEVLLSYAEAKIEANQIDATVYSAINLVRERAGLPDVDQTAYNSQTTLRTLIRRERRSELAMEGLRWWDIQRWQIGPQVMPGEVYGAKTGTVSSSGAVTLTGNHIPVENRLFNPARIYLWPIPQSEINVNGLITQNPGY